jgi:indoleamine 2,3-dioxygenase
MQNNYTDGFFKVSPEHGFLPIKEPLKSLPDKYKAVQQLIDNLPTLILDLKQLNTAIAQLPEYDVSAETDVFVIQALYRAYAFLTSAYLLAPAHHNQKDGIYGKALNMLPANLAKPFVTAAEKLDVTPWLEYHYAYSLGNYVKIDPHKPLHWNNLKMACSFTGNSDETGFIMNHVYINEKSPDLLKAIYMYLGNQELEGIKLFYHTLVEMNERRKTMWMASDHRHYNNFRTFIMGIKGNEQIFGPGVRYELGNATDMEYRQYRGQTGAQDDIIPTADIFSGVTEYYPENQLTAYLKDLREYRPKCVQHFFKDLQTNLAKKSPKEFFKQHDHNGLLYLLAAIEQIYLFRNGHWQFVQKYIMANTKYSTATGGTPVISWLPNQIEACLKALSVLITSIDVKNLGIDEAFMFSSIKDNQAKKLELLDKQLDELKKENFSVARIYNFNIENDLEDRTSN